MAKTKTKTKQKQDLADHLHASGIRKRTAELLAEATDGRRKPAKQLRSVAKQMKNALADIEDRAKGGPAKRSAAAKKGAETRKKNAAKRSGTAKKAAATRKKAAA
jgi:hypothetical protein